MKKIFEEWPQGKQGLRGCPEKDPKNENTYRQSIKIISHLKPCKELYLTKYNNIADTIANQMLATPNENAALSSETDFFLVTPSLKKSRMECCPCASSTVTPTDPEREMEKITTRAN